MALCLAYEMLSRMANYGLQPADEICYRVVMQLCGLYSQPVIAVKVYCPLKVNLLLIYQNDCSFVTCI